MNRRLVNDPEHESWCGLNRGRGEACDCTCSRCQGLIDPSYGVCRDANCQTDPVQAAIDSAPTRTEPMSDELRAKRERGLADVKAGRVVRTAGPDQIMVRLDRDGEPQVILLRDPWGPIQNSSRRNQNNRQRKS